MNFLDLAKYHVPGFLHVDIRAPEGVPVWSGERLLVPLDTLPHEVAHLCVASKKHRALPDYGFGYNPDGTFYLPNFCVSEEDLEETFACRLQLALMLLNSMDISESDMSIYGPMPSRDELLEVQDYRKDAVPKALWPKLLDIVDANKTITSVAWGVQKELR